MKIKMNKSKVVAYIIIIVLYLISSVAILVFYGINNNLGHAYIPLIPMAVMAACCTFLFFLKDEEKK